MPPVAKSSRRERTESPWYVKLGANLRSQLQWTDFFIGLSASLTIALLLVSFHYQALPRYIVGEIASEDLRAAQDVIYVDTEATAERRESARNAVPAVYILNSRGIVEHIEDFQSAFAKARESLGLSSSTQAGSAAPRTVEAKLAAIEKAVNGFFPSEVLRVLLARGFSASIEDRAIRLLDRVLRDGVIRDSERAQYLKFLRMGIFIRDDPKGSITSGSESAPARDVTAAREHLRQFQADFADLTTRERSIFLDFLENQLFASLTYDEKDTKARREAAALRVQPVEEQIRKGKTIIRAREEVTAAMVAQVEALRKLQEPRALMGRLLGYFFFTSTLIYALWRYFVHYQRRHLRIRNHALLMLLIYLSVILVTRLIKELALLLGERLPIGILGNLSLLEYAIPFAFGAILVTLLVDTNLGILTGIMIAITSGLFYSDIYLASYVFLGSLSGIYSVRQYKDRAAMHKAGLTIGVTNFICIIAIDLLRHAGFTPMGVLSRAGYGMAGGLLTSAIASMLLPPLETLFRITTDIRLLELSNLNAPALRRMSVEAPGTYHHSIMVGTLGEAAAEAIGANPLLVRVGAFYHDLGKMLKPEYFVENQAFGINKHEHLSPNMSCLIIASHVKEGMEMAREIGLPEKIRDLIPEHHGTRVMSYFFQKAKESADARNEDVVEGSFRYPGPKPQTPEAAIMMMADSVEAASRTLHNPSAAQIQGMIERLVGGMVDDGQFDECDITLRDIARVKGSFLKTLTGIHHRRVEYPDYDFKGEARAGNGKSQPQSSSVKSAKAS